MSGYARIGLMEATDRSMARYLNLDEAASELSKLLGRNCRKRRRDLKMTQAQLSERSGVAASHLSHIENGRANPTLEIVEQIAETLGCDALDLLRDNLS